MTDSNRFSSKCGMIMESQKPHQIFMSTPLVQCSMELNAVRQMQKHQTNKCQMS